MKAPLSREDEGLLRLILKKAKPIESGLKSASSPLGGDPALEAALAELKVLIQSLDLSPDPRVQKQAELTDHLHPGMTARHFLNFLLPIERLLDRNLRDEEFLVTTEDSASPAPRRPLYLVLDNLRSAFNVGSIFRTAETLGCEGILLCGYTPGPESDGVRKTAMGTESLTPSRRFEKADEALAWLGGRGVPRLALETSPDSLSLYEGRLPGTCAFVVGNERFGLDFHTLRLCDEIRRIPLVGSKNSLNVASALSIACFEWHRQRLEA